MFVFNNQLLKTVSMQIGWFSPREGKKKKKTGKERIHWETEVFVPLLKRCQSSLC